MRPRELLIGIKAGLGSAEFIMTKTHQGSKSFDALMLRNLSINLFRFLPDCGR
jgi:hypothetical protein